MYRKIVVSGTSSGQTDILYRAVNARLTSAGIIYNAEYNVNISPVQYYTPVYFTTSVRLRLNVTLTQSRSYVFELDVDENQPRGESVEEITSNGVRIAVYNENGVLVCDNGISGEAASATPPVTSGSGEMTSVPGEEPGEMTSEPVDGSVEMTSEPIDNPVQ